MVSKTLRLEIPEWHGGGSPYYVLGSQLLAAIAPQSDDEVVRIAVDEDFSAPLDPVDGINHGEFLLRQQRETRRVLLEKQPERVIVFGGDCSVTQVPFDYLSGRYGTSLGVLWLDAHPDCAGTAHHLHEMPLADLLGLNPGSELKRVEHPVPSSRAMLGGLIEEDLRPMDMACKEQNVRIVAPERLEKNSDDVLEWIAENGIAHLAVHWDLDVLSPVDFRSIYTAEPYTNPADFPAAVGRMTLAGVARLLNDVSHVAEMVGLSITEHVPWDAINLQKTLSAIPIFVH